MARRRRQTKGGTPPAERRARTGLRAEDEALWQQFTQTIEPSRFRPRVPETEVSGAAVRSSRGETQTSVSGQAPGQAGKARGREAVLPGASLPGRGATAKAPSKASPQAIDHKAVRRLGSGRTAIDARVDLHGLRQSEAHDVLRRFLFSSVHKGHRMVLVITGKGGPRREASVFDPAYEAAVYEGRQDSGVLRRQVPLWLREPELQQIVVGFTTAHVRHGGEGALYVQLRRRK